MSLTRTQLAVRGGRARQALLSPEQRTEMSVAAAKVASSKRCVCGHRAGQHAPGRWRPCAFHRDASWCTCTEYRPRGDMPSERELRRIREASMRSHAAEAIPVIDRMMRGLEEVLEYMPAEPVARCRIKAHADRPLDPKRKNFCADCAAKQRVQDVASWRKRHGTVTT